MSDDIVLKRLKQFKRVAKYLKRSGFSISTNEDDEPDDVRFYVRKDDWDTWSDRYVSVNLSGYSIGICSSSVDTYSQHGVIIEDGPLSGLKVEAVYEKMPGFLPHKVIKFDSGGKAISFTIYLNNPTDNALLELIREICNIHAYFLYFIDETSQEIKTGDE